MKARVFVRIKSEVSDPQGQAIQKALATVHGGSVRSVRVGKIFDLELDGTDRAQAETEIRKMATDILSNPIIEEFTFVIDD